MESVIRSVSDGQKRLIYDVYTDPKTRIDPRQFNCQLIFGIVPNTDLSTPLPIMDLGINCRCGTLSPLSKIEQTVDVSFKSRQLVS